MDRVCLFQFPAIIFIRTALREIVAVIPIELGELFQGVVPVVETVARLLISAES